MRWAYGTTRTVLLTKKYAFKLPACTEWRLLLLGLLANMQEVKFSHMSDDRYCPVLWSLPGGLLVIMRYAAPLTREELLTDVQQQRDEGVWDDVPVENKQCSFGKLDDIIVAVDYGN